MKTNNNVVSKVLMCKSFQLPILCKKLNTNFIIYTCEIFIFCFLIFLLGGCCKPPFLYEGFERFNLYDFYNSDKTLINVIKDDSTDLYIEGKLVILKCNKKYYSIDITFINNGIKNIRFQNKDIQITSFSENEKLTNFSDSHNEYGNTITKHFDSKHKITKNKIFDYILIDFYKDSDLVKTIKMIPHLP